MSIGIGINENVVIAKASLNEKGTLEIEFRNKRAAGEATNGKKVSAFDATLTAGVQSEGNNGKSILVFGPLLPDDDKKTKEQKLDEIVGLLQKYRNKLTQLLMQFMLEKDIDLHKMDVQYAGTGIVDGPSFNALMLDQAKLDKVSNNVARRFVELITPHVNDDNNPLRIKLTRQSKNKPYPTIPDRFLDTNPWVELMDVPADKSHLSFTKWEKDNGYDSAAPVTQSDTENKNGSTNGVAATIENPFQQQQ